MKVLAREDIYDQDILNTIEQFENTGTEVEYVEIFEHTFVALANDGLSRYTEADMKDTIQRWQTYSDVENEKSLAILRNKLEKK